MSSELLVFDTSDKQGFIASARLNGEVLSDLSSWTLNVEASHSERLLWGIHRVLEARGLEVADLDAIAVGVGPGSFTGLRIGVSTARTLAQFLEKPLYPFSSLELLVKATKAMGDSSEAWAIRDAFRGEWYVGRGGEDYEEVRLTSQELQSVLQKRSGLRLVCAHPLVQEWAKGRHLVVSPDFVQGALGWEALKFLAIASSQRAAPALDAIRPNYLRESHAELKLKSGELKVNRGREELFAALKKS